MKLTPEVEILLGEVKERLRMIGHMSRAGVEDPTGVHTSFGTMGEAAKGLLCLAKLKKALETLP